MFSTFIYEPIFNTLLFLHRYVPGQDMGLAIIAVTLLIKGILYLPSLTSIRASRQLQTLQPQLKALQEKYKDNKEALAREQMKLYKESKVNPLSSCLPIVIQLPILFGLYRVFLNGLKVDDHGLLAPDQLKHLYDGLRTFYENHPLTTTFLGFINLANRHNIVLALIAGVAQFWQSRMLAAPKEPKTAEAKDEALTSAMNRQMMYIFPFVTAWISYTLPAGLGLYWAVSTLFTVGQQYLFLRRHPVKTVINGQTV